MAKQRKGNAGRYQGGPTGKGPPPRRRPIDDPGVSFGTVAVPSDPRIAEALEKIKAAGGIDAATIRRTVDTFTDRLRDAIDQVTAGHALQGGGSANMPHILPGDVVEASLIMRTSAGQFVKVDLPDAEVIWGYIVRTGSFSGRGIGDSDFHGFRNRHKNEIQEARLTVKATDTIWKTTAGDPTRSVAWASAKAEGRYPTSGFTPVQDRPGPLPGLTVDEQKEIVAEVAAIQRLAGSVQTLLPLNKGIKADQAGTVASLLGRIAARMLSISRYWHGREEGGVE